MSKLLVEFVKVCILKKGTIHRKIVGVIVAESATNIGYAVLSPTDKLDKKQLVEIAKERTANGWRVNRLKLLDYVNNHKTSNFQYRMSEVLSSMDAMLVRAHRYYK